ncbi:MAG: prepilin-type N-terminal cleavage/methylation domain-containing protein [bacterium]|nr:prepilin-type N-terminal cleavage/methylation domain-containing protein [bacterium]
MITKSNLKSGFTILELIIVISITMIILVASAPLYTGFYKSAQLNDGSVQIVQTLRTAQQRAISRYQKQSHGVKFETDRYTLYFGDSYATRQSSYDKVTELDSGVSLTNTLINDEVNFEKGTGIPNSNGSVTLIHATGDSRQILINAVGKIESN